MVTPDQTRHLVSRVHNVRLFTVSGVHCVRLFTVSGCPRPVSMCSRNEKTCFRQPQNRRNTSPMMPNKTLCPVFAVSGCVWRP
eukprot:2520465-Alexandrium_andersonii.AAC.1